MDMHGAEVCQLSQVSTADNSDQLKITMEQPTVIISQSSRIQSVGQPINNLSIHHHHQPHIAFGSSGDLETLSYQHHSAGESSPLPADMWTTYNEEVQHPYPHRSVVITQAPVTAINASHFSSDVNEMREHLHLHTQYPVTNMDDNNNHTLPQTVDEVIASTLKDDCIHTSPVSRHEESPGSHHGSPDHHGHTNSGTMQFLNLGSAHSTISENLSQLKYTRHHDQQGSSILLTPYNDSRSSPVSQVSEYDGDLNITQLTSVVPHRNNALYLPTSQAGGYDNNR